MQIRLLVAIFSCFTFIMLFFLIRIYINAMASYELPNIQSYNLSQSDLNQTYEILPKWVNRLANKQEAVHIYPAAELEVKLLFAHEVEKPLATNYRIAVGKIDDYQFFCINQVFVNHSIQYSYYKIGESIWLVVTTPNLQYLNNVLKELKRYDIEYTLAQS